MQTRVDEWEDEICALQDQYEQLINEVRCARDERATEQAVSERALLEDRWLN